MANQGFSAAEEIFGSITGLTAKESSDGRSGNVAEATNEFGDTVAHDTYGETLAPSVTYVVTGEVTSLPSIGSIVTYSGKKVMITNISISTQAGNAPTVTISGNQVQDDAVARRTYSPTISLKPRCKAQDVASAFGSITNLQSCTTTISADFASATVAGEIVSACATHGKIEVQATATDTTGSGTITAGEGYTITAPVAKSSPDEGYIQLTATATKFLAGTEAANG